MSGHTPGPWRLAPNEFATVITSADAETEIAEVYQWDSDFEDEHAANARLIAAAPELLSALQYVMSAHGEQLDDAFAQAHAAIRKATTGESA